MAAHWGTSTHGVPSQEVKWQKIQRSSLYKLNTRIMCLNSYRRFAPTSKLAKLVTFSTKNKRVISNWTLSESIDTSSLRPKQSNMLGLLLQTLHSWSFFIVGTRKIVIDAHHMQRKSTRCYTGPEQESTFQESSVYSQIKWGIFKRITKLHLKRLQLLFTPNDMAVVVELPFPLKKSLGFPWKPTFG